MWINNTSLFCDRSGEYSFLAHRGLAQTFDVSKVEWDTNTAEIIDEPEHPYLENTLESMEIAFEYGSQCMELDIQLTKDGYLAIFHDDDLSMRTDGETYPFRGKGIGLMPELQEVLDSFPDKELLIHMNHGDVRTAEVEIKNMEIHIPLKYAKFLWGWPNKFVERMESVNTKIVIVEGNGKWSEG